MSEPRVVYTPHFACQECYNHHLYEPLILVDAEFYCPICDYELLRVALVDIPEAELRAGEVNVGELRRRGLLPPAAA